MFKKYIELKNGQVQVTSLKSIYYQSNFSFALLVLKPKNFKTLSAHFPIISVKNKFN